jgi:hypothetical protein
MIVRGKKSDESREVEAGRRARRLVAGMSAAALASLGLMVGGGAGSAQAATGTGYSGWSSTGVTLDGPGSSWYKASSTGFNDFNLTRVAVSDWYSGWYWQNGAWVHSKRGYFYKASSNTGYTVLMTSMNVGSNSTLDAQYHPTPVYVTVNY